MPEELAAREGIGMMKSSVRGVSDEGDMRTETCSSWTASTVLRILNYRGAQVSVRYRNPRVNTTHLEDDVLGKDVLDARDDVLGLALGELDRLAAALQHRAVRSEFGHLGELLGVGRLALSC